MNLESFTPLNSRSMTSCYLNRFFITVTFYRKLFYYYFDVNLCDMCIYSKSSCDDSMSSQQLINILSYLSQ